MYSGIFHSTYNKDMALRRTHAQKIRIVLLIIFMLVFPFLANRYYLTLANQVGIAIIGAIGLNILVGYTGQISLGQGGFMAVGAYTAGILTANMGMPWWASTIAACFMTALVGTIFGIPSLRLKGLYLAIATLAAQVIILWVVTHWDALTGGVDALVVPNPMLFGIRLNTDFNFYWITWGMVVIVTIATVNLFRTHFGRAFIAIRDQDIAASVMGVDLFRYKLLAFAVSSFLVGLAGALTAHYRSIVTWERFTVDVSVTSICHDHHWGVGISDRFLSWRVIHDTAPGRIDQPGAGCQDFLPNHRQYYSLHSARHVRPGYHSVLDSGARE